MYSGEGKKYNTSEKPVVLPKRTGREALYIPLAGPRQYVRDFLFRQLKRANSEEDSVVTERLARGELSEDSIKTFLQNIPLPDDLDLVIAKAKQFQQGIVGALLRYIIPGSSFDTIRDLELIYRYLPEPVTFEERAVGFLAYESRETDVNHSDDLFRIAEFVRLVYGERYEYWEQLKRIMREAAEEHSALVDKDEFAQIQREMNALVLRRWLKSRIKRRLEDKIQLVSKIKTGTTIPGFRIFDDDPTDNAIAERISFLAGGTPSMLPILQEEAFHELSGLVPAPEYEKPSLIPITEVFSEELLSKTEIHAEPYQGRLLTQEILKKEGLRPQFQIPLDGGGDVLRVSSIQLPQPICGNGLFTGNRACGSANLLS